MKINTLMRQTKRKHSLLSTYMKMRVISVRSMTIFGRKTLRTDLKHSHRYPIPVLVESVRRTRKSYHRDSIVRIRNPFLTKLRLGLELLLIRLVGENFICFNKYSSHISCTYPEFQQNIDPRTHSVIRETRRFGNRLLSSTVWSFRIIYLFILLLTLCKTIKCWWLVYYFPTNPGLLPLIKS